MVQEFVSCPSCGRTLFDLQEVTASIRERTSHLPGVAVSPPLSLGDTIGVQYTQYSTLCTVQGRDSQVPYSAVFHNYCTVFFMCGSIEQTQ